MFEYDSFPGAGVERAGTSVPNYFDRLAFTDILESQALYRSNGLKVGTGPGGRGRAGDGSDAVVLHASCALAPFADGCSPKPTARSATTTSSLLSHAFAAKQPGGMDGIVGRDLRLNDEPYLVVGVLSEGFAFLDPEVRIFTPLAFDAKARSEEARHSQNHQMIGRLAGGRHRGTGHGSNRRPESAHHRARRARSKRHSSTPATAPSSSRSRPTSFGTSVLS